MPDIRLIATDLDGTFFDSHSNVIPENVAAFREAQAAGIAVAICSGRCPVDIAHVHRQMGMETWVIGFNGAIVHDPTLGQDIYNQPMDRQALEELLIFLEDEMDTFYNMCNVGLRYLWAPARHMAAAESARRSLESHGLTIRYVDSWRDIPDEAFTRCMKVNASSPDPEKAKRLRSLTQDARFPLTVTSSWWSNIEVVAQGVDKGKGILRLCDYLGITADKVMVLGDQWNDLPMFQVAGWPVAMANGDDDVKAAARVITGTNNEAGVAQAVRRYALNQG